MDAAGPPVKAAADDDICAPSVSRTSFGLPPFFARLRGTRPPSPSRVLSWGSSHLASSTRKDKGDAELVRSGATYSDDMVSSSASSLGSLAMRKVEMDRRRGQGGDGMTEVVRAGGAAIYGAAYRGVPAAGKVVAVMDFLNHKYNMAPSPQQRADRGEPGNAFSSNDKGMGGN